MATHYAFPVSLYEGSQGHAPSIKLLVIGHAVQFEEPESEQVWHE
jgi:hypothetical protein